MRGTTRRIDPRGLPPGRGAHSPHPFGIRSIAPSKLLTPAVSYTLARGPYQNNGATPWYANVPIGTPGQVMKVALDTGSNFIWTTSTLCQTGCQHYGDLQFNYANSQTFRWLDTNPQVIGFGPWGNMTVELGRDFYALPAGSAVVTPFYLASQYSGQQFEQLDWDGGIGLPSGDAYADQNVPNIVSVMMNRGLIDPAMPYMSFATDASSGVGTALLGGYDESKFDPYSGIYMPWTPYTVYPGVEYIWTTPLASYQCGPVFESNYVFCLDSGSSQFKGDTNLMNQTLAAVANSPYDLTLGVGTHSDGSPGTITVPPSVYNVQIQAGPEQGQILPQFNPLGLDTLVLVGSVLMDQLYTVFEYRVTLAPEGVYYLSPYGMYLFNKVGGPNLIGKSKKALTLGRKKTIRVA